MPFESSEFRERSQRASIALQDDVLGPVQWVGETGSTNADLLAAAATGAPHGLVRVADYQSSGRGRRDRQWVAAPGDALLMSVLLRTALSGDSLGALSAAVGVSAVEHCRSMGCEGAKIKWPNDVVVGEPGSHRKLGGILAQSQLSTDSTAVVVGLGLNLVGARLGDLAQRGCAMDEFGPVSDPVEMVVGLVRRLSRWLCHIDKGDGDALWTRYRDLSATLGTRVVVSGDDATVRGEATEITSTGALVIDTDLGPKQVVVGDVVSLRSHGESPP